MICKNWRDIVTDDVKLIIDADTFIYTSASANTTKVFKVFLKETGKEFFKAENVEQFETVCTNSSVLGAFYNGDEKPIYEKRSTGKFINERFKNITEFKGRKKKTIEGWLGEHNLQRESEGKEPYKVEDFEFDEELIPNEIHFAYGNFNRKIQEVKDYLGVQEAVILVGTTDCHRHKLEMPLNPRHKDSPEMGRYKGSRVAKRPPQLGAVRDYVLKKDESERITGIEADDALNIYMYESHKHYKRYGTHKYIGISIDKDSMSHEGLIFNFMKDNSGNWKHPHPYLITGLGELYLNKKGSVKGYGYLFKGFQILAGDSCDTYSPTKYLGISFGDKSAYNLLKGCKSLKEMCEVIVAQYYRWFPDNEVKFTSWSGKEITMTTYEWLNQMYVMVAMLRERDKIPVFTDILDSLGVPYKTNPNVEEPDVDEPNKNITEEEK
jgi:hypothetical protein